MALEVPASKQLLVFGATGVIGKVITSALIRAQSQGKFDKIGIFTSEATVNSKPDQINWFRKEGVEVITGDISDNAQVLNAYRGYDTVISAVGRNAISKQIDLIRLAASSGTIRRFLPSEYGTDIEYNAASAQERPHQKKLAVRAYIRDADEVCASNLRWTYLVTGPFADLYVGNMAAEPQLGSFDVGARKATLLGDGNGRVGLTTMADVGRLVIAVLQHPEVCDNRAVKANSYTTTPNAILAEFERQTDAKWNVTYTSLAGLRDHEERARQRDNPLASLYTLRRIWTEGGTLYDTIDNEIIGMKKTDTLEMTVQEMIWRPVAGFQSGKL